MSALPFQMSMFTWNILPSGENVLTPRSYSDLVKNIVRLWRSGTGQLGIWFFLCKQHTEKLSSKKMDKILQDFFDNSTRDKDEFIRILELLTVELQNPDNRNILTSEFFEVLTDNLQKSADFEILSWILRIFRNALVGNSRNQGFVYQSSAIHIIIYRFLESRSRLVLGQPGVVALALQVVGNSIATNAENSETLLSEFDAIHWISEFLHEDDKVSNYSAMIGLTLTQNQAALMLQKINTSCLQSLIDQIHLEFPVLWLEALIALEGFLRKFYPQLEEDYKVKFLHTLTTNSRICQVFPEDSLEFLVTNFKNSADQILTTNSNGVPDEFNVLETTATVEFFCKIVHTEHLGNLMKSDMSFVISTIALLRSIHEIGASGHNYFTPIEKLETLKQDSQGVESEPGFLFKADLIRLLGSLVQGILPNQNQVREMGVLPVILNCTKVDARNPFIPQCSIVTLKFLLDGNPENQAYVHHLKKNE